MTKRSQGTRLPQAEASKTPQSPTPAGKPLREYRSRAERESEIQRFVILGVVAATAVAVVILAIAFVVDQFITPNQAVAVVNGETITVGEFRERVRLERAIMNERINEAVAQAQPFGDQAGQYLQFVFQQEPFSRWGVTIGQGIQLPVSDQLGALVLDDMIQAEIIRAKAAELGITVTQEDIQEEVNEFFQYDPEAFAEAAEETETPEPTTTPTPFVSPTPSPTPLPTTTPEPAAADATATWTPFPTFTPEPTLNPTERAEQFNTSVETTFTNIRNSAGISQETLNAYFEVEALKDALADTDAVTVEATGGEVRLRHILVETEEEAQEVIAALNAGESFADLAQAVSTDTGSASNGGIYDWSPASRYVEAFAEAARTLEIGAISEPIQTEFGYHVMQVLGRRDAEVTDEELEQARTTAVNEYVETLEAEANIERFASTWASNVPSEPFFVLRAAQ